MAEDTMAAPGVPWWLVLMMGIVAVFVGIALLMQPAATTVVVIQVIAWYWLIVGFLNLALLFVDRSQWGWKLFMGFLGIVAGFAIIGQPILGAVVFLQVMVIILGIDGIIIGVVDIVRAFQGGGWGIGALGVLSLFIGGYLLANYFVAAITLPYVFAIMAIVFGLVGIVGSFMQRSAEHHAPSSTSPLSPA